MYLFFELYAFLNKSNMKAKQNKTFFLILKQSYNKCLSKINLIILYVGV